MAGDSTVNFTLLHRTCKLVVLLCFLHISVTVVFYVRSLDLRNAFVQNQQSHTIATQTNSVRHPEYPSGTEPKEAETKKEVVQEQKVEPKLPEKKAEEPGKKAEEPVKKAEEPVNKAEEPGKKAEEPVNKAEEPGKKAEEPGKKAEEPVKKAEEPVKKAEEPVKKAEEPVKKAEEPVKKAEEPGKKAEEPGKKAEEPVKKAEEPVKKLEKCPETSPLLVGPLRVEFNTPVDLEQIKKDNPNLRPGGRFKPKDCEAQQKVAIIIPFRKRDEHLKYWLFYLHPILQRQQLDYGVYVINQDGDETFNRAKLLNVGYAEALKEYDYGCFIFSDVDLIPMDDRNTYKCFSQPRHLSVAMDKFGFRLPYNQYFGGVSSMSKEQYLKINGFPNNYWGWGGEDDDIFNRLSSKGMSISRPSGETGRCRMIRHDRDKQNDPNPQRFDRIAHTRETMYKDGINSLSYKVVKLDKFDLFTKITVDVGKP